MDATTQEGEGTGKGQMRPTHNPDAVACDFYLSHKRRFCRTAKRAGGRYCPTHDVNGTTTGETTPAVVLSSSGSAVGPGRTAGEGVSTGPSRALQRVPCPINPNHTVYADKLQKHVKVCPDLRFVVDKLPYYSKDLHACKGVAYCVTSQESEKERFTHHHMDTVVLEDLITRVRECYFNVIQPRIVLLAEECQEPFQDNSSTGSTRRISNKHGPQHRALLRCVQTVIRGYAEGRGNLGNTYVRIAGFLELGAGKAGLAVSLQDALLSGSIRYCHSHPGFQERKEGRTAVNEALSADNGGFPRIVVVDMDNFRRKADACVRNSRLPLVRLRINIKDLDLAKALCGASTRKRSREETSSTSDQCTNAIKQSVPVEEQWVAVGKHLCGACTDFALSCVTAPNLNTEGFASVCAVVFATCCHQRCELKHINALLSPSECRRGRIAIPGTNHTFSEREFAAITSMSSWAVSGEAVDAERRLTGMCCKRVIDAFRLEYLKQSGFRRTYLCQYAESSVTGENICIVAFRRYLKDESQATRENTSNTVPHNCFEPIGHTVVNNNVGNCETSQNVQSNEPQSGKQPPGEQSTQFAAFIPPGGTIASAFNIAATTLGAGIFGLPSSAGSSGLIMGMFYLFFISCMTIYSMRNLALAADRSKAPTYESVTFVLMGRRVAYAIAVLRALDGFTSCVAYVISVGDILSAILKGTNAPDFLKEKSGNRLLTAVVWACFMLPLAIPRHVDSLRYVSTFAVTFMVYFVIVIVVHSCMNGLSENIKNVSVGKSDTAAIILFNSGNEAIEGLGVFMFSYTCQDTAYEVYIDMKDRSVRKFVIAAIIAMSLCTALYIITAFFGYMDFGRAVSGSILLMYDPVKEPAVMVGMIGVLVKLVASYALLAMACRNALYSIAEKNVDSLPFWKHCVSVIVLSTAALLLGLFIPNVNTVLGFSGSITGGSLGFVFPALLIMYSGGFTWQKVGSLHYLATYVLLICGVVGIVFGTGASIWGTITG